MMAAKSPAGPPPQMTASACSTGLDETSPAAEASLFRATDGWNGDGLCVCSNCGSIDFGRACTPPTDALAESTVGENALVSKDTQLNSTTGSATASARKVLGHLMAVSISYRDEIYKYL
jgi:hypothetical protein